MYEEQSSMGECANGDIVEGQNNMNITNQDRNDEQNVKSEKGSNSAEGAQPAPTSTTTSPENKYKRNEEEDDDEKKLFVGGLSHDATEEQLRSYFSKFGEVSNINIKSDLLTKKPRGFAFVTFCACDAVTEALKATTHTLNGKPIDPKRARARPRPPPVKKIFVGGLSPETSEEEVINYFKKFGKVENVELPFDKVQNKRRAFCFVCFDTEQAANDAAAQSKQLIPPMTKHCDVKIATPPKSELYNIQPGFLGRGRDWFHGGFPGFGGMSYGGGYSQNFGSGSGSNFNQNYGSYNSNYGGSNCYDYYNSAGYNGGYSGSNYDSGYWNYNQNNYGGGYGESQCSDDYTRDTM